MTRSYLTLMSTMMLICSVDAAAGGNNHPTFARVDNDRIITDANAKITTAESRIYTATRSNGEIMKFRAPQRAGSEAATITSIQESFEDWNGIAPDWLPEGWSLQSKNGNATWHVSKQTAIFAPTNGKVQMICNGASTEQEEILITPEFNVLNNYRVYADLTLSLFDIFDKQYFDETTKTFTQRRPTATVIVKAYVNSFWNEIYNVASVAGQYSDEELYNEHSKAAKTTLRINLERFAGEDIKLAFIYKGVNGQDVALDYVAVQQINNQAVYRRPQGFFFIGIDQYYNQYNPDMPWMIGPAYVDATWLAYATRDVEEIRWTFFDGKNQSFTTTEGAPSVSNIYSVTAAPALTAISSGVSPVTYQFDAANKAQGAVAYGGDSSNPTTGNVYGFGNYNPNAGIQNPQYANDPMANVFGPSSNSEFWHNYNRHVNAIGNYYEKPLSPYWFDKLWIAFANFDADADAEFTVKILPIDGSNIDTEHPIAVATAYGRDAIKSESGLGSLTFDFGKNPVVIDQAIMVHISGFMDTPKVRAFAPVCQAGLHIDGENTSYAFYYEDYFGKREEYVAVTSYLLNNFNYPFVITFNGCFPFLFPENHDNTFSPPAAGGEKVFTINSLYKPSEWDVENLPDWVSNFQPGDTFEDIEGVIKCDLIVEVEQLPDNITGRWAKVLLTAPGIKCPILIKQGNVTSIDTPMAENEDATVMIDNGIATITTPADVSSATICNMTGALIATVNIAGQQANFTLPEHGIYIAILNNGQAIKFAY